MCSLPQQLKLEGLNEWCNPTTLMRPLHVHLYIYIYTMYIYIYTLVFMHVDPLGSFAKVGLLRARSNN